jgi:hypothetical protein
MTKIPNRTLFFGVILEHLNFEFVSDWSETDASPDIRTSDFDDQGGRTWLNLNQEL